MHIASGPAFRCIALSLPRGSPGTFRYLKAMRKDVDEREHIALAMYTQKILEFRNARDWAQFHGVKDQVLSLASEVGELADLVRWLDGDDLKAKLYESKNELSDEIADIFYWVLLIAHDLNINIDEAFHNKMEKNSSKYPVNLAKGSAKKYTELNLPEDT